MSAIDYPLFEVIERKLEALDNTKTWLAEELGVSTKTIYSYKSIKKLDLETITTLSRVLDIDLLDEYNKWLQQNHEQPLTVASDLHHEYEITEKIAIQVTMIASIDTLGENMGKVLHLVKAEGAKYGITIKTS